MQATKQQIIRVRAIMSKLPRFGEVEKGIAVLDITGGRTSSISQMHEAEASILIADLQRIAPKTNWQPSADPRIKMQRKIIAMAHEIGWNLRQKSESGKPKIDMKKLNDWCKKSGYLKKEFNKYTYKELPQLVAQFEKVYYFYLEKLN